MKIVELQRVPKNKIGRIVTNDVKVKPHEESTAVFLAQFGFNVEFLEPRNTYKSKNADFSINGSVWETKSPDGKGNSTVSRQFHEASKQANKLVLDLRRIKLPAEKAERQAKSRFASAKNIKELLLITKDGKVLDITR